MFETKDLIILAISFISLLVSLSTLYFTQLSVARVQIMAGEHLNIGHFPHGNLNISLPVTFVNHGARTAIVRRVALLVQTPGSNEGYLLEPLYFQRIDEKGDFLHDSLPTPIGIGAKENVTKQVLFRSSYERPTEFQLTNSGTYVFTLLGWMKNVVNPDLSDSFSIIISKEAATNLQDGLANKSVSTERITQAAWRNWTARSLTEYQVKGLIS
jgi:hypothetical protein